MNETEDRGEPSDEVLLHRFHDDKDTGAFDMLFQRHKSDFLTFLWRLAGSRVVAEDVSQQCWLKLIERAAGSEPGRNTISQFRTYLFTMGRNHFLDAYVRKHEVARTGPIQDANSPAADATPEKDLAADEQARRLHDAVAALPLEQREVIALWSAGTPLADISTITGSPRDTVLSRKKYALAKLRSALADTEESHP